MVTANRATPQRTSRQKPPRRLSGDKPDWLPPAIDASNCLDWPAVWMISYRDGLAMDAGLSWVFDVRLQWPGGNGYCTTWAISGAFADQPELAIQMLRERARDWGFERVYMYSARPPLDKQMRERLREFNLCKS